MKKRSPKHEPTKKSTVVDWDPTVYMVQDLITRECNPRPIKYIEALFQDLVQWAIQDDNARKISQFITMKRLLRDTYYDWVNKFSFAKTAHEEAKRIIGDRRELGGLDRKYEPSLIKASMHHYDPDWVSMDKHAAAIKQQEAGDRSVTINMKQIPSSDMVPDKEKNEKV